LSILWITIKKNHPVSPQILDILILTGINIAVLNNLINKNPIYMGAHFSNNNISVIETENFVKG